MKLCILLLLLSIIHFILNVSCDFHGEALAGSSKLDDVVDMLQHRDGITGRGKLEGVSCEYYIVYQQFICVYRYLLISNRRQTRNHFNKSGEISAHNWHSSFFNHCW